MGACPERNLHVRLNRRLARPTPFLVPPLRAASRSRPMMRLDMGVDEALSRWSGSRTHRLSIGGTNEAVDEGLEYWVKRHPDLAWYFRTLYERFCLDAHAVCEEAAKIHEGFDPDPRAGPIRAEVRYVCRKVMVCTLEDLLERRAGFLYWDAGKRLERLRYGAHVIQAELGLTEEEFERQFTAYSDHLTRFFSLPSIPPGTRTG